MNKKKLEERCETCTRKACPLGLPYFAELIKQEKVRGIDYTAELEKIKQECVYRRKE